MRLSGRWLGAALAACLQAGCSHHPVAAPADSGLATRADAASRPAGRRRRSRRGSRNAVASAHGTTGSGGGVGNAASDPGSSDRGAADPGAATSNDLALAGNDEGEDDDPTPAPRPRMTETGPMLPDDVGRQGAVNYDMRNGTETSGPMGLDPSQISEGLRPLMSRFTNCAAATGAHGHVGVRLRIQNSGAPAAAHVTGAGPAEFVTCVRRVIASARFDRFNGPDAFATWGFDVN